MTPSEIALLITFIALVLIGLVGNLLVSFIIIHNRDMKSAMNYLLLNLAIADFLTVLFLAPQYIFIYTFTHPTGRDGDMLCKFMTGGNISWIGGVSSVFALVSIACERYYAVMYPHNQGKISTRTLRIIIITCWLFSVVFNAPLFFVLRYDANVKFCIETWPRHVYARINSTAWFLVVGVIPVLIMGLLYSRVVYHLWIRKDDGVERHAVKRVRKRVTKMVIIVSVIYAISWFPQLTMYLISYINPSNSFGDLGYVISVAMVAINSAVNPIIYSFQNERFRRHLRKWLCCRALKVEPDRAASVIEDSIPRMALDRRKTQAVISGDENTNNAINTRSTSEDEQKKGTVV